jgi:hypothetical protein
MQTERICRAASFVRTWGAAWTVKPGERQVKAIRGQRIYFKMQ